MRGQINGKETVIETVKGMVDGKVKGTVKGTVKGMVLVPFHDRSIPFNDCSLLY